MISIVLRYTVLFVATLLILTGLSYTLAYLFPGEVLTNLSGLVPQNDAQQLALEAQYKLDQSYFAQFWHYLTQLWEGNWGYSFISGQPLKEEILVALPATIELSAYAMFITLVVGIPLGCYAGLRAYSAADATINATSVICYSFPVYWLALVFIMSLSLDLGWMPLSGRISLLFDIPYETGFILFDIYLQDSVDKSLAFRDAVSHLILPTLSIAVISTASMVRIVRRSIIDVVHRPYIAAARSKGLSSWQIFYRHILRNALLPVLPLMAMLITTLITNALIVETLFSWPGIGNWLIQAIYQRDYPALRVGMLAVSSLVVFLTITVDLFNRLIDPSRERFESATI